MIITHVHDSNERLSKISFFEGFADKRENKKETKAFFLQTEVPYSVQVEFLEPLRKRFKCYMVII